MSTQVVKAPAGRGRYGVRAATLSVHTHTLNMLGAWSARSGERKARRELAEEGRLLDDIGLNRQQALREAAKPFWRR